MKTVRCLLLLVLTCAPLARADSLTLKIGAAAVRAEVAATSEAREHGLMQRKTLCADCGMLFVFSDAKRYGFWMKDTPLPLSIAFIARDGRVVNIDEMQAYSLEPHFAQGDILYALEMNRGWFAAHGVKPGDTVEGVRQEAPVRAPTAADQGRTH